MSGPMPRTWRTNRYFLPPVSAAPDLLSSPPSCTARGSTFSRRKPAAPVFRGDMTQSWPQFESPRCRQGERVSEPAAQMDLSLQVGKYDVQRALGKGATGMVYLAKDTFTGGEVALKTIEPEVFRDPEFGTVYRSQFQNEASLAGKLRHPHIVAILDAVVQQDSGYIAMEYVKGGDLSRHV